MAMMFCPECGKQISDRAEVCIHCGYPIEKYFKENNLVRENEEKQTCPHCGSVNRIEEDYCENCGIRLTPYQQGTPNFNGIYKYTRPNVKIEVRCPRCNSTNCSHYVEQVITPGKTKTRYTANLNPLKPFTLVNKKEKQVTKEKVKNINKIRCNKCGFTFE